MAVILLQGDAFPHTWNFPPCGGCCIKETLLASLHPFIFFVTWWKEKLGMHSKLLLPVLGGEVPAGIWAFLCSSKLLPLVQELLLSPSMMEKDASSLLLMTSGLISWLWELILVILLPEDPLILVHQPKDDISDFHLFACLHISQLALCFHGQRLSTYGPLEMQ